MTAAKLVFVPRIGFRPAGTRTLATAVGDPPIVTFTGAVLRVDGPLRLELPLA